MKKFEYTVLDVPAKGFWGGKIDYQQLSGRLNELGKQGWEVISSGETNMWRGASRGVYLILKREVQNN